MIQGRLHIVGTSGVMMESGQPVSRSGAPGIQSPDPITRFQQSASHPNHIRAGMASTQPVQQQDLPGSVHFRNRFILMQCQLIALSRRNPDQSRASGLFGRRQEGTQYGLSVSTPDKRVSDEFRQLEMEQRSRHDFTCFQ